MIRLQWIYNHTYIKMSTSVERVLNNPYLLVDIMRHVAKVDKLHNVVSSLCVSQAFRNPHVIRETPYIFKPLRERVTEETTITSIDIDYVNNTIERKKLNIDKFLRPGDDVTIHGMTVNECLQTLLSLNDTIDEIYTSDSLRSRLMYFGEMDEICIIQLSAHRIVLWDENEISSYRRTRRKELILLLSEWTIGREIQLAKEAEDPKYLDSMPDLIFECLGESMCTKRCKDANKNLNVE